MSSYKLLVSTFLPLSIFLITDSIVSSLLLGTNLEVTALPALYIVLIPFPKFLIRAPKGIALIKALSVLPAAPS